MTSEITQKRWTVQRLREVCEHHLQSHQFRLESLEARQQLLERLLCEVLDSANEDDDEPIH